MPSKLLIFLCMLLNDIQLINSNHVWITTFCLNRCKKMFLCDLAQIRYFLWTFFLSEVLWKHVFSFTNLENKHGAYRENKKEKAWRAIVILKGTGAGSVHVYWWVLGWKPELWRARSSLEPRRSLVSTNRKMVRPIGHKDKEQMKMTPRFIWRRRDLLGSLWWIESHRSCLGSRWVTIDGIQKTVRTEQGVAAWTTTTPWIAALWRRSSWRWCHGSGCPKSQLASSCRRVDTTNWQVIHIRRPRSRP
jgi:hypothetical protein